MEKEKRKPGRPKGRIKPLSQKRCTICKNPLTWENVYIRKSGVTKGRIISTCKLCYSIASFNNHWRRKETPQIYNRCASLIKQASILLDILEERVDRKVIKTYLTQLEPGAKLIPEEYTVSVVEGKKTYLVCKACGSKKITEPSVAKKHTEYYCDHCKKFNLDVVIKRRPKLPEYLKIYEIYLGTERNIKKTSEETGYVVPRIRNILHQVDRVLSLNITFDQLKEMVFSYYGGNPE